MLVNEGCCFLFVLHSLLFGARLMQTECLPTMAAAVSIGFALLFGARRINSGCLQAKAATLSVCFALLFGARRMQTVSNSSCLPTMAAASLLALH